MSAHGGPNTAKDGLVLALDAASAKSYPGSGTAWKDLSGNSNNGTLSALSPYSNGSFTFDGVTPYAYTSVPSYQLTTDAPITLDVWVQMNSTSGTGRFLSKMNDSTSWNGFAFYSNSGYPYLFLLKQYTAPNISLSLQASTLLSLNTWYNLTAVYTGSFGYIYINGQLNVSAAYSGGYDAEPAVNLSIGGRAGNGYLNGKISKTTIYNRALSANEIQQNFNATRSRFGI